MPEFEKLQFMGSLGRDFGIEFAVVKQQLGDGYSNRITIGSSAGTRDWRLALNVMPGTPDGGIMVDDELQSKATYFWEFYCRHMARASASFIITDSLTGKDFLVGFAENKLTFREFAFLLFSSGVQLEYRREPGVATLEDGSLGVNGNPDSI